MVQRHAAGKRGQPQDLLYDPSIPTPTHAERARTLCAGVDTAALATLAVEPAGYPYGSFVTFALLEGDPILLASELAEHTKNLHQDPRSTLLVTEPGEGDPLARGRVSLVSEARLLRAGSDRDRAREAFLAAHPGASYYADFKDFGWWRLEVRSVRYIGGYGRMSWVEADQWRTAEPDPLAPHARRILEHMNQDHAEALILCCRAFSKATDASEVRMVSVDRYGFDMSVRTGLGPRPVRVAFQAEVRDAAAARKELVALTQQARTLSLGTQSG
jgi:putative heme iron utilization protein